MWYERIKRFYSEGLWTKEQVAVAVRFKKITAEQYKEITNEDYVA